MLLFGGRRGDVTLNLKWGDLLMRKGRDYVNVMEWRGGLDIFHSSHN